MGIGPLAIVDRDGTLIEAVRDAGGAVTSAFSPAELRLLPGAVEGLALLGAGGFTLAIATNQPGPAKGQATRAAVDRTNAALVELLAERGIAIAAIEVCFHHPLGGPGGDPTLVGPCGCRKPAPGMLLALLARLGAIAEDSWMIGDAAVDIEAGRAAGVRTAWLGASDVAHSGADVRGASLVEIAHEILRRR